MNPTRIISLEALEAFASYGHRSITLAERVRLARHRARRADDRVLLEIRSHVPGAPLKTSPGRRIMRARLAGRLVLESHGVRAKRGEYGTPREVRAHERGMTRSGYQTVQQCMDERLLKMGQQYGMERIDACPPTERNDR